VTKASSGRIVVVGGSMGGLRAAEAAAKTGYAGEVLVIGDEDRMPYNRPPLSKEALHAGVDEERLEFRIPRGAKDVVWRLGTRVAAADLDARTVTTSDGETIDWDGLVVATGLRPRRLELGGPLEGRHVIRTLDDATALRTALLSARRLVVVGAGFIGCEVAATARTLGLEVDVVAPEDVPMQRPLRHELGEALQRRHEKEGVRFHLGTIPVGFGGTDTVTSVELADGTVLEADLVVEAVGCTPEVEWLEGNDLDLRDGLLCDNAMRVEGRPDVVACGDVARFPNLLLDDVPRRVEHWMMVTDSARRAGATLGRHLLGEDPDLTPFAPVPSFWSDQYDLRIQSFGSVSVGEQTQVLEGDLDGDVAVGYFRDDALVGVVMVGLGGRHRHYRDLVATAH
jgi:3-phenylpropionate/trans-cinnamate dioxygenase ferredoxin reductase subunit